MSAPTPEFPLAQTALDWLKHGNKEKYELRPHGERAIELSLKALFASGLDPKPPIELLLGLASTLHHEWDSPTAAKLIVGVLLDSQKVKKTMGVGTSQNDYLARGKAFLDGRKTRIRAPQIDAKAPKGSIKMSDLLGPAGIRPGGKIR